MGVRIGIQWCSNETNRRTITIRVDDATLEIAKKRALALGKPLRSLLREIIEDVLKEAEK